MTNHGTDVAAFLEEVGALDVQVSVNEDGVYTACSDGDLLRFCFDGYSQAEVAERVLDTIESYGRLYRGIEGLKLRSHREDVTAPSVRVEAPRPISKLALVAA